MRTRTLRVTPAGTNVQGAGQAATVNVAIADDDVYQIGFETTEIIELAEGDQSERLKIQIIPDFAGNLDIGLANPDPDQITLLPSTVTIFTSDGVFSVQAIDDRLDDPETYTIALIIPDGLRAVATNTLTVNVPTDESDLNPDNITVNGGSDTLVVEEGGFVNLVLEGDLALRNFTEIQARIVGDAPLRIYTEAFTLIKREINPGMFNIALPVLALDDDLVQTTRSASIVLEVARSRNNVLFSDDEITVLIVNDDSYTLAFDQPSLTVNEGSTAEVVLTITPTPTADVSIDSLTVVLSGFDDSQITVTPTTIVFTPDKAEETIEVSAPDDSLIEEQRSFSVTPLVSDPLAAPVQATPLTVIVPDDPNDVRLLVTVVPELTITEGAAPQALTVLTFNPANIREASTVRFIAPDGSGLSIEPAEVAFARDDTAAEKKLSLSVALDRVVGRQREIEVQVTVVDNEDAIGLSANTFKLIIEDNERYQLGFKPPLSLTALEGSTVPTTTTVTIDPLPSMDVADSLTVTLVSEQPGQLRVEPTQITLTHDNPSPLLTLIAEDDDVVEGNQIYTVRLDIGDRRDVDVEDGSLTVTVPANDSTGKILVTVDHLSFAPLRENTSRTLRDLFSFISAPVSYTHLTLPDE